MEENRNSFGAGIRESIERLEAAIKSGMKISDEFLLKGELSNKIAQLAEANQRQDYSEKEKKEEKTREASSISYLVEQEKKLTAEEKEKYSNFLAMDYFKKSDLKELDQFYQKSWDKLSEEGKDQMDKRVAEGIRRGEFTVDEMPESMKQRLNGRLEKHGIDMGAKGAPAERDSNTDAPHAGKSASVKVDPSKEIVSEDKAASKDTAKVAGGSFGELSSSFEDEKAPMKPTEIKGGSGSLFRS